MSRFFADNHRRMKARLFFDADTGIPAGGGGNADPAPATSPVTPDPTNTQAAAPASTLAEFFNQRMAGTPAEPNPEPPTDGPVTPPNAVNEPRVDVPDKFRNPDGSVNIEALAKSYTNIEQMYGKNANVQAVETLQQQIQQMQTDFSSQLEKLANPPEPPKSAEQIQEEIDAENERLSELQINDPVAYAKELAAKVAEQVMQQVNPKIEPIVQKNSQEMVIQDLNKKLDAVYKSNYPNGTPEDLEAFKKILPGLKKNLEELGDDFYNKNEDAVDKAYRMAKGELAQNAPTEADLLNSPDLIAKIKANPQIYQALQKDFVAGIQAANSNVPPLVGTNGAGLPPSTPPVDLKDTKQAKQAFAARYGGMGAKMPS